MSEDKGRPVIPHRSGGASRHIDDYPPDGPNVWPTCPRGGKVGRKRSPAPEVSGEKVANEAAQTRAVTGSQD